MSHWRLPQELLDLTISFILDDNNLKEVVKPTLLACALVCRAWSAPSQRFLFRHVDYEITWTSDFATWNHKFSKFVAGIVSSHRISLYVQSFTMFGIPGRQSSGGEYLATWLTPVLESFVNLKSIHFDFNDMDDTSAICRLLRETIHARRGLQRVSLGNGSMHCIHEFYNLFKDANVPAVQAQNLDFSGYRRHGHDHCGCGENVAPILLPQIRELVFGFHHEALDEMLVFLSNRANIVLPALHEMTVQVDETQGLDVIYRWLRDKQLPKMTMFGFDLNDYFSAITTGAIIDLSEGVRLQSPIPGLDTFPSLWLTTTRLSPLPLSQIIHWWNMSLQTLPADGLLTSVTFAFNSNVDNAQAPLGEAWMALDVTASKLTNLKSVSIADIDNALITLGNGKIVADIRAVLPRLSAKGVLSF